MARTDFKGIRKPSELHLKHMRDLHHVSIIASLTWDEKENILKIMRPRIEAELLKQIEDDKDI